MSDRLGGNKGSMINVQSTASQPRDDRRKRDRVDEEIIPQDVGSTKKPKSSHLSNPQLQTGQQANPLPPQLDPKISYTVPVVSCQPVVSKVVDRKEALLQWQKIIWQIYDCMRALNALSLFKLLVSILEERVTEAPYLKFADVGNADLDITFVEKAEKWGRDALTFSWEGKPDGIHTVQRFLNMLDRIKIKGGIIDP
ncbi:hypothetical protein FRC03_010884 [Tulasnella sp. 419]|nr:hypothetical protein FRC03_010884 [Tulasnella sp. 419]